MSPESLAGPGESTVEWAKAPETRHPAPLPASPALSLSSTSSASGASSAPSGAPGAGEARLRAIQGEHFEFVWRSVRRLGVSEADADDATQQVFIVAAGKLAVIAEGSERAFLFAAALRVASHTRRAQKRRSEVSCELDDAVDAAPSAEELVDRRRARAVLDEVLKDLPIDVRAVFILFELEEMTLAEIAATLGIPPGTAASRLRRGRELFAAAIARIKARRRSVG
jgi:RNA polymerase sigma-70 factor (ECF subfamily)